VVPSRKVVVGTCTLPSSMFSSAMKSCSERWSVGRLLQLETAHEPAQCAPPDGAIAPLTRDVVVTANANAVSLGSWSPGLAGRWRLATALVALFASATVALLWSTGSYRVQQRLSLQQSASLVRGTPSILAMSERSEYIEGYISENGCPYETVALSEVECRRIPGQFGGALNVPFVITSPDDPQGCFGFNGLYYYNIHPIGVGRQGRKVYCKRLKAAVRFQRISTGRCMDYGFMPISSRDTCEAAAWELQLSLVDRRVHVTENSRRPEGCYYFANAQDSTGTLWLSTNADSHGIGAEASKSPLWIRQPLCMAQTTTPAPALIPTTTATTSSTIELSKTENGQLEGTIYVAGSVGSNRCPHGTTELNKADCQRMPEHFGGALHHPLTINSPGDPRGCFFFFRWYYFNINPIGMANEGRKPYCKMASANEALNEAGSSRHRTDCGGSACAPDSDLGNNSKAGRK